MKPTSVFGVGAQDVEAGFAHEVCKEGCFMDFETGRVRPQSVVAPVRVRGCVNKLVASAFKRRCTLNPFASL